MSDLNLIVKAKENLFDHLGREGDRYERLVSEKGMTDDLALAMAKNKIMLESAGHELNVAKNKLAEFEQWKKSSEYKDQEKELDSMIKNADQVRLDVFNRIDLIFDDLEKLHDQARVCETLAISHEKSGYISRADFSILWALLQSLYKWRAQKKFFDALRRDAEISKKKAEATKKK